MKLSISRRLALMFAATGFVVFTLLGIVLQGILQRELLRSQLTELQARVDLYTPMLLKNGDPARWHLVQGKLEAATPADGHARYWIVGDDARFRYGEIPSGLDVDGSDGYGEFLFEGAETPLHTLKRTIAATGERPSVRFIAALDQAPYRQTLRSFTIALVAVSLVAMLLVALLGHWVARFGLRPLERLSSEARALSPSKLSQRLQQAALPPELSELATSFNGALDRLESAYQQLEGFNADVAHELRTPLTNLIGQTQVALSRERGASELEEVLQSNLEELERLRAIINDMLFLARADQGIRASHRVEVSLAREIARTVDYLDVLLDDAGVRVRIDGDARTTVETALLGRAMTNLLINAVQHSERGAEIVAEIAPTPDGVRVSVRNPGPQIDHDHLPRLFDRFYRLDSARSGSSSNHGLGLAIVRAIATMHGGGVFVSSERGFNTFGFTLAA